MKKSEWLDYQRKEFFPKQKGFHHLVKIEHKNTATLDSARSKKKSKVAVLQLGYRILSILLPGICDTWFNIFVTSRDIENLGKLIMGYLVIYKGYSPVYFKGYGIFGTPLYKPHFIVGVMPQWGQII